MFWHETLILWLQHILEPKREANLNETKQAKKTKINFLISIFFHLLHAGPSGKAVRQYFPYVSSESDLQRYKAVTLHKQPSNDTRASSSLSNMPSDSTKTKVRILWRFFSLILCSFLSLSLTHENFSAFTLNRFFSLSQHK